MRHCLCTWSAHLVVSLGTRLLQHLVASQHTVVQQFRRVASVGTLPRPARKPPSLCNASMAAWGLHFCLLSLSEQLFAELGDSFAPVLVPLVHHLLRRHESCVQTVFAHLCVDPPVQLALLIVADVGPRNFRGIRISNAALVIMYVCYL